MLDRIAHAVYTLYMAYIQRCYRISKEHDKTVKKKSKKAGGESAYIRTLIDKDMITPNQTP